MQMKELKQEYEQAVIALMNLNEGEEFEVNITDRTIAGLMMCKRLDRIGDALEDISSRIAEACDRLQGVEETLDSCVCDNGNNHFLCITGNISTN